MVAVSRTDTCNELDVARAVRDGELPSPQKFGDNLWLFALRLSGVGIAHRHALGEITFRDPAIFCSKDFLERAQGLPVVLQHPPNKTLTSEELAKRIVGTVMLTYVRGSEPWSICRIYDHAAADAMQYLKLSTSPSVVLKKETSERLELSDGRHLLIEGEPYLLDHVAIVESGVWDKGAGPSGIEVTERTDSMNDENESGGDQQGQPLDKLLSKVDATMTKFSDVTGALVDRMDKIDRRLDALEGERDGHRDQAGEGDIGEVDVDNEPAREPGKARRVVADQRREDDDEWRPDDSKLRDAFSDVQARADNALAQWGARAPAPLSGEGFRQYRQRLLRPLQKYSQIYKDVDLRSFPEVAFAQAEKAVYADAELAATRADLVSEGTLRAVTKTLPNGSKETRFIGHPSAWMETFIPTRRAVVRVDPKGIADNRCSVI
jgi:hypothetical protein